MEVYERETQEVLQRFLSGRLTFPETIAALDAALRGSYSEAYRRGTSTAPDADAGKQRNGDEGDGTSERRPGNAGRPTLACSKPIVLGLQYPFPMECEERKRLEGIYLAAVAANNEAARIVADMRSEAWREATKDTRAACEEALADLSAHRKEHGC